MDAFNGRFRWALLLAALAMPVAAQVELAWSNEPGGVSVARDGADRVYSARWDYNPAGDIWVAQRSPDGTLLWEVRHDNTDTTRHEVATWVAADAAGNVWVSGTIRSGYASPVNANSLLMKFGPDGTLLWRRVYDRDFDGSSTHRLVLDAQGRAHVLGLGTGPAGQVSTVRQFLAEGSTGWVWYDAAGIGLPVMLKRTPDGGFVVVGRGIFGSINGFARLDGNGQTVWSLAGVASLTLGDAAGDAQGNTYVVNGGPSGSGTVLRKLSPTGSLLWERTHPMSAFRVEVGPDGHPLLSGFPDSGTGGAAFAKFSSDGSEAWTNLDAGPSLLHAHMILDAAGNAYLAGSTLTDMSITKVLADGQTGWNLAVPYGGARALALGSQGQVYVAGGTVARLDQDVVDPPPVADLALTLTDAPDPVRKGGTLVYTATLRNLGGAAADGVRYRQLLPRSVLPQSVAASQGSCTASGRGGRTIDCTLGTLGPADQATVLLTVQPRRPGTLAASGAASTTSADADPSNDQAGTTTTVTR
jgi:uncharacterized repeat protein (TIGR01451 family)